MQIVLLGFMIWGLRLIAGGIGFAPGATFSLTQILGFETFSVTIGLSLGLLLIFRKNGENYIRKGWEAGITWYIILLFMDLILTAIFVSSGLDLWYPFILFNFKVFLIPIVVGYLLTGSKSKS
ncbi:MAG: hypothetical protein ACC656_05200 [Candidatus Heimdallarchaeota archaeon]